jgi:murein DD-endopeptidase MepM/ murein hydrolase activator NlpD
MSPIAGARVFSGWGRPRPARNGEHQGLDIAAPVGTPVFAVEEGIVGKVAKGEHAGLFTTVQHAGGWTSRYMHLDKSRVAPGQRVEKGAHIADSGSSGISSSAPHLHFDMLLREDKLPLYTKTYGEPVGGYGARRAEGRAVPSEPIIPVSEYADQVIRDAGRNNVSLYVPVRRPFPWGKAFAGLSGAALLFAAGLTLWPRK